MSLFGTHLTILAGPGVPLPLPATALAALDSIEISSGTTERSGLQAQFKAGRGSSLAELADYPIMNQVGLKAGARLVVLLTIGIVPQVLFDGIVTQSQLSPGQGQGDGTLAVSAEDIRVKMDQVERDESYPGMPVAAIAAIVMARYATYGLVPTVIPPLVAEVPLPIDRVTTQSGTRTNVTGDVRPRSKCTSSTPVCSLVSSGSSSPHSRRTARHATLGSTRFRTAPSRQSTGAVLLCQDPTPHESSGGAATCAWCRRVGCSAPPTSRPGMSVESFERTARPLVVAGVPGSGGHRRPQHRTQVPLSDGVNT